MDDLPQVMLIIIGVAVIGFILVHTAIHVMVP